MTVIERAIESAKCRIYKLNYEMEGKISPLHQKKAEYQKELMEITVEALEKQIPKKPNKVVKRPNGKYGECPVCNHKILKENYCSRCGQKLDWEEGAE